MVGKDFCGLNKLYPRKVCHCAAVISGHGEMWMFLKKTIKRLLVIRCVLSQRKLVLKDYTLPDAVITSLNTENVAV